MIAVATIKRGLLSQLCGQLENTVNLNTAAFEQTRQDVIEAEGRMKSRYDSTKEESGQLGTSLSRRILEAKEILARLQSFQISDSSKLDVLDKVTGGSVVTVKDQRGEESIYFFLPVGGGEKIQSPDFSQEVRIVTFGAPLFQALSGKKVGDSAKVATRELEIISVL